MRGLETLAAGAPSRGRTYRALNENQRRSVACELRGEEPRTEGPQPGDEFVTALTAAEMLRYSISGVHSLGLPAVQQGPCGRKRGGRRANLYRLEHVERVIKLRRQAGISYMNAARVVTAEFEGRL